MTGHQSLCVINELYTCGLCDGCDILYYTVVLCLDVYYKHLSEVVKVIVRKNQEMLSMI